MKELSELSTLEIVEEFLENNEMIILYFSTLECSTCYAILHKLRDLLDEYPLIQLGHIDASHVKTVAEKFLILTAPIMILIVDQKEYLRADRFVRFDQLKAKLDQIYNMYTI